jgi:hypothetical protein
MGLGKRKLLWILAVAGAAAAGIGWIASQDVDPNAERIEEFVKSHLTVSSQPISSKGLEEFFDGSFYRTQSRLKQPFSYGSQEFRIGVTDAKIVLIKSLVTSQPMPGLTKLLKEDAKIASKEDALRLKEGLDALIPPTMSDRSYKGEGILQSGDEWYIVRGKFFRDLKGFRIETDAEGRIKSIKYALKLPKIGK